MYSSYSFAPDRQPSRDSADATGDTASRTTAGFAVPAARAFRPEPGGATPAERRDVAVAQADGEP